MFITRSLQASALFLSFFTLAEGWSLRRKHVEHAQQYENARYPVYQPRDASQNGVVEKRQNQLVCPNDRWEAFLDSVPTNSVSTFCNDYLGIPPATTVVEYTPTVSVCGIPRKYENHAYTSQYCDNQCRLYNCDYHHDTCADHIHHRGDSYYHYHANACSSG